MHVDGVPEDELDEELDDIVPLELEDEELEEELLELEDELDEELEELAGLQILLFNNIETEALVVLVTAKSILESLLKSLAVTDPVLEPAE